MLQVCEGKPVHSGGKVRVKMEKQDEAHRHPLVLSWELSFPGRTLLLEPLAWETLQASASCPRHLGFHWLRFCDPFTLRGSSKVTLGGVHFMNGASLLDCFKCTQGQRGLEQESCVEAPPKWPAPCMLELYGSSNERLISPSAYKGISPGAWPGESSCWLRVWIRNSDVRQHSKRSTGGGGGRGGRGVVGGANSDIYELCS